MHSADGVDFVRRNDRTNTTTSSIYILKTNKYNKKERKIER